MERPDLPPLVPGRSALTAFLPAEANIRDQLADARGRASRRVEEAEEEAARIRQEGEDRLRQVVVDAEREALREAEDRARDRVSEARAAIQRWVEQAEEVARDVLDDALGVCCDG